MAALTGENDRLAVLVFACLNAMQHLMNILASQASKSKGSQRPETLQASSLNLQWTPMPFTSQMPMI